MLKEIQPNLSAQAQKFRIFEKYLSLGVRSPCLKLTKIGPITSSLDQTTNSESKYNVFKEYLL